MRITVQLPTGTATLDVADDVLVFNGEAYVQPKHAMYLELYSLPVNALSKPMQGLADMLHTQVSIKAKVVGIDPVVVPVSDPSVIQVPDPAEGMCICGITCAGTDIRFAVVQPEN